jgi:hypothetical protein
MSEFEKFIPVPNGGDLVFIQVAPGEFVHVEEREPLDPPGPGEHLVLPLAVAVEWNSQGRFGYQGQRITVARPAGYDDLGDQIKALMDAGKTDEEISDILAAETAAPLETPEEEH